MMPRKFECVELQHRMGCEYMRKLRAMTDEEKAAFYEEETRKLREFMAQARARRQPQPVAEP
ncbi:MAG: hypothetical protein KKI08_25165 [Armatimonadetes bacterium]|nr:hypothetical protein [Armatimonadota bacterium]